MNDTETAAEMWLRRLDRRVSAPALISVGLLLLAGCWMLESWLSASAALAAGEREAASVAREDLDNELSERAGLRDMVSRGLSRAKASAATLSRSRRVLFEGSLALSEEKRLLEKQWEIMTTFLHVEPAFDRVQIMRGEQAFETLPLAGARARAVGGESRPLPRIAAVISKERFASPERGKSEQTGGQLLWEPPQVGTSARARALGEYVMFTKEGLVLHGPPLDQVEHEAFPHLCLSLPLPTARKLYTKSFIGTKVRLEPEGALEAKPQAKQEAKHKRKR